MTEDLAANYSKAYCNSVGFGKSPALVLIDFALVLFNVASSLLYLLRVEYKSLF